jgi:threonine dehydrogenase-like Zn-dependent dehydrogenase
VSAWRDAGTRVQGCYAQFVIMQAVNVIHVPGHLPHEATAPVELAMCVAANFLMLKRMDVVRSRRFGVTGLGPAGLIAAQIARAEGAAEIIGFDLSPARRDYAASGVVDAAYSPRDDLGELFPARPQAATIETSMDCVGAKASVEFTMDHTSDVVSLFGVQRESYEFAMRHYLRLRLCGYAGHSREAAEYAVELIDQEVLDLSLLSTHHLPLERYNEGIELLEKQEAVKICFWPWRDA